jgi:hypothetical protein
VQWVRKNPLTGKVAEEKSFKSKTFSPPPVRAASAVLAL